MENIKYDVACVGILVADVITKPVDELPGKGLLGLVDSIELFTGGNAMTASINLRKMGLKSAIVGKIGNDSFGDFLKGKLNEYGVNTDSLAIDNEVQTSCSVALSSSDGERTFLHCVGANGTFSIDDVNWDVIEQSRVVFVTGTNLLNTFDGQQTADFLKKCQEMGKITALDVCWDSKNRWDYLLQPAMPYIDYFLPSIEEAEQLAKETDLDKIAAKFFEWGVKNVVIKCGSRGCYVNDKKSTAIYPVLKGIKAVDTTGAGDSFCSGFLAAFSKGNSIHECAKIANATGAQCVTAKGATTGITDYEEVLRFLAEHQ